MAPRSAPRRAAPSHPTWGRPLTPFQRIFPRELGACLVRSVSMPGDQCGGANRPSAGAARAVWTTPPLSGGASDCVRLSRLRRFGLMERFTGGAQNAQTCVRLRQTEQTGAARSEKRPHAGPPYGGWLRPTVVPILIRVPPPGTMLRPEFRLGGRGSGRAVFARQKRLSGSFALPGNFALARSPGALPC